MIILKLTNIIDKFIQFDTPIGECMAVCHGDISKYSVGRTYHAEMNIYAEIELGKNAEKVIDDIAFMELIDGVNHITCKVEHIFYEDGDQPEIVFRLRYDFLMDTILKDRNQKINIGDQLLIRIHPEEIVAYLS